MLNGDAGRSKLRERASRTEATRPANLRQHSREAQTISEGLGAIANDALVTIKAMARNVLRIHLYGLSICCQIAAEDKACFDGISISQSCAEMAMYIGRPGATNPVHAMLGTEDTQRQMVALPECFKFNSRNSSARPKVPVLVLNGPHPDESEL